MIRAEVSPRILVASQETDLSVIFSNDGPGTCTNLIFKLVLPGRISLVSGSSRIEVPVLAAGETVTRTVRVRPAEQGTWLATSTNFSYRDRFGSGRRVEGFEAKLVVEPPAPESPEPNLVLSMPTVSLPLRTWKAVTVRIDHVGGSTVHAASVQISGRLHLNDRERSQSLGRIAPGDHVEFTCPARAEDSGDVPVYLDVAYVDASGRRGRAERSFTVLVGSVADAVVRPATDSVRILYLAANPLDTDRTRWEQGFREIEDACRRSRNTSRFELTNRFAVRDRDIGQALIDMSPQIVQFSGHGSDGGLHVESAQGRKQLVAAEGLVQLFELVAESVSCVVLGVCHSMRLARDLARHVEYAIGMDGEIDARSMINFSIGFYQAFAAGWPVTKAFETGRAHIALQAYNRADQSIPKLFVKGHGAA